MHSNKIHKGIIYGYGYVFNGYKIYLTLHLNRIKYQHEVNTNLPFTIYGEISEHVKNVIDEINMKRNANKYNL
jgi:hypothetical protein